jgi:hypothetical protein
MSSPSPTPADASSSPAGSMFNVPPRPPQGGGWGHHPPQFSILWWPARLKLMVHNISSVHNPLFTNNAI